MPGQEGIASVFSPMARTLHDLTYFTRSIIQMKPWTYDPSVHPIPWHADVEESTSTKKPLRIGLLLTDNVVDPSPACLRALKTAADALTAAGHDVFPITPPSPLEALVIASNLLNSDGTRTFRSFFRTGESDDPGARAFGRYMRLVPRVFKWLHWAYTKYILRDETWAALLEHWHEKSTAEQWAWVAKREAYKLKWHEWWNSFGDKGDGMDFLLTPPNALPAVPHGAMSTAAASCGYTFLFNLLDYSAGIVPVTHVDKEKDELVKEVYPRWMNGVARGAYRYYDARDMHGLPVAVQLVGRRLEEEKVLAGMKVLEDALEKKGEKYQLLNCGSVSEES
jgi:Asp-tRNA(Asn)/Glu-tRNA(Gln) amidotransferase A subunit family amidase